MSYLTQLILVISIVLSTLLISKISNAETELHPLVRKVVVFPMDSNISHSSGAEKAWWRMREVLTNNKRFLIASKKFMIQKDVYQPRSELKPADAILLGRLLDAHGLVTSALEKRTLKMTIYSGVDGFPLWSQNLYLHPSVPVNDQLEVAAEKLIMDFIASVPYHGFHITDPLKGTPTYEDGDIKIAKADIGSGSKVEIGETVQWVQLHRKTQDPLFQSGGELKVIAEGVVFKIEPEIIDIEIKRVKDINLLKEGAMIRIPKEVDRLEHTFALRESLRKRITPNVVTTPLSPTSPKSSEARPLITALNSLASFIAFLIIAL